MKEKLIAFFRQRPLNLRKDYRKVWLEAQKFLNRNSRKCLIAVILLLVVGIFLVHPNDQRLLQTIRGEERDPVMGKIAGEIGHWGDFLQFNLGITISIWLFGYVFRSRWWQRLACASLLAAILAGVTVNLLRFSTGRPRPKAQVVDGFYGFPGTFKGWNYHSFPSGHTSTAFGSGVPIYVAAGPWSAPVVVFSGSVAWARMYDNQHYPMDVLFGGFSGCLYGLACAWHLRAIRKRTRRRKKREESGTTKENVSTEGPESPDWAVSDS